MRWMVLALLVLGGCKKADPPECDDTGRDTEIDDTDVVDTDTEEPDTEPAPLVGMYDGLYTVSFQRGGSHFAIGGITVEYSQVSGEVRSGEGLVVTLAGRVTEDGGLVLDSFTSSTGAAIALVDGNVRDGVFEGTYTLDAEEGFFAGTLNGERKGQDPTSEWDGAWEIATVRDGDETSAFVIDIKRGRFRTTMVTNAGQAFDLAGWVTSDGTIILTEVTSEATVVMATASIDQDTYDIEGVYRAGDAVGRITGRRGD